MILSNAQESGAQERVVLERTLPAVEGIVLASSRMSDSAIRMTAKQRPTIVLNRAVLDVPSVVTDTPGGTRRALEHLRELGHELVTYVAGPEASWADGVRWQAVRTLIAYIGGATAGSRRPVVLPTRLVVRASTARRAEVVSAGRPGTAGATSCR